MTSFSCLCRFLHQSQIGIAKQRIGQGQGVALGQEFLSQLPQDLRHPPSLQESIQEGAGKPVAKDHVHRAFGAYHRAGALLDEKGDQPAGERGKHLRRLAHVEEYQWVPGKGHPLQLFLEHGQQELAPCQSHPGVANVEHVLKMLASDSISLLHLVGSHLGELADQVVVQLDIVGHLLGVAMAEKVDQVLVAGL